VGVVSWCDKLASIPSAGFRLDHHYLPADKILESWHSILDANSTDDLPKFTLTRADDFNIEINGEDGFKYGADASRIHVGFNHRVRVKNISGGGPVVEMLSSAKPFTKLLPDVIRRLIDATLLVPGIKDRKLQKCGITSTTPVDEADLPPGIVNLIEHVGRPWKGLTGGFTMQLTANVDEQRFWTDRCIHTLVRPEVGDDLMTIVFDYQRIFTESRKCDRESLKEAMEEVEKGALKYFEALAEGTMFDDADSKISRSA
jgi:hypothetical protein